ncbi:hypothetical protein LXO92_15370, partial [Legionella sp. 8cVS16]|nr:hypothetical protein [Legionella sp. 8cVS16]
MDNNFNLPLAKVICAAISLFTSSYTFAAGNFTISPTPGTVIPTTVPAGSMVSAYYTITNNTSSARVGYVLRGLPNTVLQNLGSNFCSNPVNLAAHASCVLRLDIFGQAQSGFALCKGSSCTTACVPLNVVVV